MPTTVTVEKTTYSFDELDDRAKQKAREKWISWRDANDFDHVKDMVVEVGEMLGIEFETRTVKLMGGGTREDARVWWALSYSQGDGASFDGRYRYKAGAAARIRKEWPTNKELHNIAQGLQDVQRRHFYRLAAVCSTSNYGNLGTAVYHLDDDYRDLADDEKIVDDLLNSFAHWIYTSLRDEDEYQCSNEVVDDCLLQYHFDEEGNIQ